MSGVFRIVAAGVIVGASLASGQNAAQTVDARPAFEVATLKKTQDDGPVVAVHFAPQRSGDRFTWPDTFLLAMIEYAYNVPATHIEGFQDDRHLYTLAATLDPSVTEDQARLMLQALLQERLKMTVHRETRDSQGYALVVVKNGPKITAADPAAPLPPMPPDMNGAPVTAFQNRIITHAPEGGVYATLGRGVTMRQLADELSDVLKTPVADRTGMAGKYFFEVRFEPPNAPISASQDDLAPAAEIYSALPAQLGLKLEKAKVPAEYLVVEHWEQPAAE